MPEEQKEKIWQSFQQDKIIKIVRDQSLLNDCILYNDYVSWLNENDTTTLVSPAINSKPVSTDTPVFSKLAFK